MTEIIFPYNTRPKRIPFYVNDLVFYWELGIDDKLYLISELKGEVLKDILLEETGLVLQLINPEIKPLIDKEVYFYEVSSLCMYNSNIDLSHDILVKFKKYGSGLYTLGLLDPHRFFSSISVDDSEGSPLLDSDGQIIQSEFDGIDSMTLGEISMCYANWMIMSESTIRLTSEIDENVDFKICLYNKPLSFEKNIDLGVINGRIAINSLSGYKKEPYLGDLDPFTLDKIDPELRSYPKLTNIPAIVTKEE